MKKSTQTFLAFFMFISVLRGLEIQRIEPPNWWDNMEKDTLSLLIYGDDFRDWDLVKTSRNMRLVEGAAYANSSYYSARVAVRRSGSGYLEFRHKFSDETERVSYDILQRDDWKPAGLTGSDIVYLLMPDRFADGNSENNTIPGHKDPVRPDHRWGRRGGDLQGVMDHVDYLKDLGVTALWMTPVYENNYINCYHGYTPSDLYAVEPHFGDMSDYHELVALYHRNGIKIIQDHIVNHISPDHPIAVNPPSMNWINGTLKDHEDCNYSIKDVTDPYVTQEKKRVPLEGWFAGYLADMNLNNPEVVEYWINHAVWWMETFHLDGIRQDTYAYSDLEGLSEWGRALKREYPEMYLVGEVMEFDRTRLAYFYRDGLENGLDGLTDFGISSQIYQLILEDLPVEKFYRSMANDFIYSDPVKMLVFMDNHDMGRFFSACSEDVNDYLNAFTLIFSMRGIPQIFYGNEIGLPGGHDPENRSEFPGGFSHHKKSAFIPEERTALQTEIHAAFRNFARIRRDYPGVFRSSMVHDHNESVYLLAREDAENHLMLVTAYNTANRSKEISYEGVAGNRELMLKDILKTPREGGVRIDKKRNIIELPPKGSAMVLFVYE